MSSGALNTANNENENGNANNGVTSLGIVKVVRRWQSTIAALSSVSPFLVPPSAQLRGSFLAWHAGCALLCDHIAFSTHP